MLEPWAEKLLIILSHAVIVILAIGLLALIILAICQIVSWIVGGNDNE